MMNGLKNSEINMLNVCLSVISVILISACSSFESSKISQRETPEELDIQQQRQRPNSLQDEFVFCDPNGGAWGCKKPTPKTKVILLTSRDINKNQKTNSLSLAQKSAKKIIDGSSNEPIKAILDHISHQQTKPKKPNKVVPLKTKEAVFNGTTSGAIGSLKLATNKQFITQDYLSDHVSVGIIYFDFDSSILSNAAKKWLKKLSTRNYSNDELLIVGYTDSFGTASYNNWLSLRRAKRVEDFLIKQKPKVKKIETKGLGLCCYIVEQGSKTDQLENRRVEIFLKK